MNVNSMSMYLNQSLVGAPLTWNTAAMLHCLESGWVRCVCWPTKNRDTVVLGPGTGSFGSVCWLRKLYTQPQATWILSISSPPPDWDLEFQRTCLVYSLVNITLGLSAPVQTFWPLAQARCSWRYFLFRSSLTQGKWQLNPTSWVRLCVVILEALTPAAVHS